MLIKNSKKMKQIKSMTFKSHTLVMEFWILIKFINPLFCIKETQAIISYNTKTIAIEAQKVTTSSCD